MTELKFVKFQSVSNIVVSLESRQYTFLYFCFPCLAAGVVKFLYSTILSFCECSKHFTLHCSPVHSITVSGSWRNIQLCSIYYTETILPGATGSENTCPTFDTAA